MNKDSCGFNTRKCFYQRWSTVFAAWCLWHFRGFTLLFACFI